MAAKKKLHRPSPLSKSEKATLSRILKKAREFKAFYHQQPKAKRPSK